jgi:DNA gyrase subunit A
LCSVFLAKDEDTIITTKDGFSIRIDSKTVVPSGRTTMGTKGITLREGDYAIAATPVRHTTDTLAIFTESGIGKRISLSELPTQSRGGKGLACYKPTEATGNIAAIALVEDTDDLLISGNKTNLCISASEIPILGRASIGNIIIKGSKILSVSKV